VDEGDQSAYDIAKHGVSPSIFAHLNIVGAAFASLGLAWLVRACHSRRAGFISVI
jgi:hypothetical protein